MANLTHDEMVMEIRSEAKFVGMTFKQNKTGLWGAYNRATGAKITEFRNVMCAYDSMLAGWFDKNSQL